MSSGNPESSMISEQDHITESLQYYNIYSNNDTRVNQRKSYNNIVYKPFVQTIQLSSIIITKHNSGVAIYYNTKHTIKLPCPRATHLLLIVRSDNSHAAQSKTDLLMRLTCNKGQRTLSIKVLNKT